MEKKSDFSRNAEQEKNGTHYLVIYIPKSFKFMSFKSLLLVTLISISSALTYWNPFHKASGYLQHTNISLQSILYQHQWCLNHKHFQWLCCTLFRNHQIIFFHCTSACVNCKDINKGA